MPLVFGDEICYEKTPDYFDRPFVPERMSRLNNSAEIKFIHVLCDPVRRSFSHFLHMFATQQSGFTKISHTFANMSREEAFEERVRNHWFALFESTNHDTFKHHSIF